MHNLRFCSVDEIARPEHNASFDVVTCMETLEHCLPPVVECVLADLERLVAPGGRMVISVPIETGPTFAANLVVRKIAGWSGLEQYRSYENYSPGNALRMIFATRRTQIERLPRVEPEYSSYSHYGFNWRALRDRVAAHFEIERTMFTPLGFLRGFASSQAWFICKPFICRAFRYKRAEPPN